MNNLGNCYYWGHGVEQDYGKAAEYHSKAANLGYANSQEVLGELYFDGKGVEQNYTQAAYWFKEGCENGERTAFGPLGDCYREGLGVEKDERMAFELYQTGAQMEDLQSKVALAECLIEGWGTHADLKKAFQILEGVCSDEEEYREKLVTMVVDEDEKGRIFWENPLDEYNLKYYAKAYFLLGTLYYARKGTGGSSPSKASSSSMYLGDTAKASAMNACLLIPFENVLTGFFQGSPNSSVICLNTPISASGYSILYRSNRRLHVDSFV